MNKVYCIGYGGMKAERLARIVGGLDAVLVDIRFRAASRLPDWNKSALTKRFGDNYVHLSQFGNAAYKTGGMQIADYNAGRQRLGVILETLNKPVVLLCACKEPHDCHRTVVGAMLRKDGFEVIELNLPAPVYAQPDLFGGSLTP